VLRPGSTQAVKIPHHYYAAEPGRRWQGAPGWLVDAVRHRWDLDLTGAPAGRHSAGADTVALWVWARLTDDRGGRRHRFSSGFRNGSFTGGRGFLGIFG
jgi:hypothetical protein